MVTAGHGGQTNAQISAVAELLGEARLIGYRPCFARAFGGAACAVLLSQFWFWTQTPSGREPERDGWFWKSQAAITEETGLSRTETETARRKLRDLGVLQEDVRGLPATLHYRLDIAALLVRLGRAFAPPTTCAETAPIPPFARNRQTSLRKACKPVCGNPANLPAEKPQAISEKTSEKPQKNIRSQTRPVLPAALNAKEPMALTSRQCQVNRQGTALLKAALQQATWRAACRSTPPREPP